MSDPNRDGNAGTNAVVSTCMDLAMSESAKDLVREKGGTVAIDWIPKIG